MERKGKVLFHFRGTSSFELSVEEDEIVDILEIKKNGFALCQKGSQVGEIPTSYLEVTSSSMTTSQATITSNSSTKNLKVNNSKDIAEQHLKLRAEVESVVKRKKRVSVKFDAIVNNGGLSVNIESANSNNSSANSSPSNTPTLSKSASSYLFGFVTPRGAIPTLQKQQSAASILKKISDNSENPQEIKQPETEAVSVKNLPPRERIIRELIETEKTYVKNLGILVNEFLNPLKLKKNLLKENLIKSIFSNVETILNINNILLKNMYTTSIGESFQKLGPFLKMYTTYTNNYEHAFQTYQNAEKTNSKFASFLKERHDSGVCGGLYFKSFLILPIQRIPRYKMLLTELLTHTPNDHPEYNPIKDSLEKITQVANFVNEKKREDENNKYLMELQNTLPDAYKCLIQPYRKYVKEAVLAVSSASYNMHNEHYKCYFFTDMLLMVRNTDVNAAHYVYFVTSSIVENNVDNQLSVQCLERCTLVTFTFIFTNAGDRESWQGLMQTYIDKVKAAAKKLKGIDENFMEVELNRITTKDALDAATAQHKQCKSKVQKKAAALENVNLSLERHQRELEHFKEQIRLLTSAIEQERQEQAKYGEELEKLNQEEEGLSSKLKEEKSKLQALDQLIFPAINCEKDAFKNIFDDTPTSGDAESLNLTQGHQEVLTDSNNNSSSNNNNNNNKPGSWNRMVMRVNSDTAAWSTSELFGKNSPRVRKLSSGPMNLEDPRQDERLKRYQSAMLDSPTLIVTAPYDENDEKANNNEQARRTSTNRPKSL